MKLARPPCSSAGHILSPRVLAKAKRLGIDPRRLDIHAEPEANNRFRCPKCRKHYCWRCEGRSGESRYMDSLCDTCWSRETERRKKRRKVA